MDHKQQHHEHHQKEREHEKKERKEYERQHAKDRLPFHPAWLVGLGIILTLLGLLVWVVFIQ
jgi:hypothetical protein